MEQILKFPRTKHLTGSGLQAGDGDLPQVDAGALAGRSVVITEKIDGANAGLSFDAEGRLWLQSRGHYLTGGHRERHFDLFKQWASGHAAALRDRLSDRFLIYGEWLFARHTAFYDALPDYFVEFDVFDRAERRFLCAEARRALLDGLPVASAPVVWSGVFPRGLDLMALIGPSAFKTEGWREALTRAAEAAGVDVERAHQQADPSILMEGLYIKIEEGGQVVERLKLVRPGFTQAINDADGHWLDRPIVRNQRAPRGLPTEGDRRPLGDPSEGRAAPLGDRATSIMAAEGGRPEVQ